MRALVNREIAAHAVAGAVAVIDSRLPQMHPRQCVELAAIGAEREARLRQLDMTLEHAGVAIDHLGAGFARADPDGTGDVGGPIEILPARIAQENARGRDRDVRLLVHLVMRQRGMAARGTDGVEAGVLEVGAETAEFAQFGRSAQLVHFAGRGVFGNPAQEAHHRGAVARLGIAMALLFGGGLDRLGQDRRVLCPHDHRSGLIQRVEDARHRTSGVDRHAFVRQALQRGHEFAAVAQRHRIAEMLGELGRDLVGGDEQVGGAIGADYRVGQRHRGVGDVGAAHVHQPGDRIERSDHRRVMALLLEPVGDGIALVGARTPGIAILVRDCLRRRGGGPVAPDRVDRIGVERDQLDPLAGQFPGGGLGPFDPVEPGVIADPRALGGVFRDPFRRAGGGDILVVVECGLNLVADLNGVAPVGEHRRALARILPRQHRRAARAAREAGQPLQPRCVRSDIFAHMLVGDRNEEAVELAALQFLAQGVEAGFMGVHQHRLWPFFGTGRHLLDSALAARVAAA